MRHKVQVDVGQILVEAVDLVVKRRGLRVWYIECHSKYAETLGWDNERVFLHAGEHTLKWNRDSDAATAITLPIPKGWEVMADLHARYSIQVVAWRPTRWFRRRHQQLWQGPWDQEHTPDPPRHEPTGVGWA